MVNRFALLVLTLVASTLAAPVVAGTWTIDPAHSSAQFAVRHMMVSTVRGDFSKISGTVEVDEKDITGSVVQATIDASSISTGVTARDNHLKGPDFFDVAKYPTVTFQSRSVAKAADGRLRISGELTMHGVTREVVLDADPLSPILKDPGGALRTGTTATTRINRGDFGLTWNKVLDGGGVTVGDEVSITIDIELLQKPAAK